jgi:hypothetical protein
MRAVLVLAFLSLESLQAQKPGTSIDVWELQCADVASCGLRSGPNSKAPVARMSDQPWVLAHGAKLSVTGYVPGPGGSYGAWRVSDGIRTAYLTTPFLVLHRNGSPLNGRNAEKQVAIAMAEFAAAIQRERSVLFKDHDFIVMSISPYGPSSAGGVGVRSTYRHLKAGSVIKYLTFVVEAYNAVGDRVTDQVTGESTKSFQITGPIRTADEAEADRESVWEPAWYNRTVTCLMLKTVRVQYMDGTEKTFEGDDPQIRHPEFRNSCQAR